MDEQIKQFISDHASDDVALLALRASSYPYIDMAFAIRQIAARQRAKRKIPAFYAHLDVQYPSLLAIEQSSSEVTARHKATLVKGKRLIDLTGGLGVDFYFMSQLFTESIYVERQIELCELATLNFNLLGLDRFSVINADALDYIYLMPDADVVVVDPHRRTKSGKKAVLLTDCEPDLTKLVPLLLTKSRTVIAKLSPMLDLHKAVKDLPSTVQVDIVAVDNECKEVILMMDGTNQKHVVPALNCYNYLKNGTVQKFHRSSLSDEPLSELTDRPLQYLYEPNASIMKSGAVNAIAHQFNLFKFHQNTHLYTSNVLYSDFPGRIFQIDSYFQLSKKGIKLLKEKYPIANVSVRNFSITAEEVKKKAHIRDGGDKYIFCFTTINKISLITICSKV